MDISGAFYSRILFTKNKNLLFVNMNFNFLVRTKKSLGFIVEQRVSREYGVPKIDVDLTAQFLTFGNLKIETRFQNSTSLFFKI